MHKGFKIAFGTTSAVLGIGGIAAGSYFGVSLAHQKDKNAQNWRYGNNFII